MELPVAETIQVQVCYAQASKQDLVELVVPQGTTVQDALERSGLLARYPEIDLRKNKFGVFAKLAKLDTPLRDKDRVEIYRPLIADPKEVRKQRAAEGKVMKKGAGEAEGGEG